MAYAPPHEDHGGGRFPLRSDNAVAEVDELKMILRLPIQAKKGGFFRKAVYAYLEAVEDRRIQFLKAVSLSRELLPLPRWCLETSGPPPRRSANR